MNRTKIAADLVTELARLIVGHPDKLQSTYRPFGHGAVLILSSGGIKKHGSDTGRLIGPKGDVVRALNFIGAELALCSFEVRIEDGTADLPVVTTKRWQPATAQETMTRLVSGLFSGVDDLQWSELQATDLITIFVNPGFDRERVAQIEDALNRVWYSIGRAHDRVIRICIEEVAEGK